MVKKIINRINEKLGYFFLGKSLQYDFYNKSKIKYLNERSIEYAFTINQLLENKCLDVLDIGTGSNSFASTLEHCGYNVTATDLKQGSYWSSFSNRHIHVVQDDITKSNLKEKYDAVLCISVLEHIANFKEAVKGMCDRLSNNGILILTFPFSYDEYCENVYALDKADSIAKTFRYIGQSFSDNEINEICQENNLEIVKVQYARGWEGKFWRTGSRFSFPEKIDKKENANLACFALRKKH